MSRVVLILTGIGLPLSAVTAGVYANFSLRVMPGLRALPDADGISRMQAFNRTAVQPPFMLCFFGAAIVALVLLVRLFRHHDPVSLLLALGGLLYLAGFLLTIGYNVPLNDQLAGLNPHAASSVAPWQHYLRAWTAANTVRAALSTGAAAALAMALLSGVLPRSGALSDAAAEQPVAGPYSASRSAR